MKNQELKQLVFFVKNFLVTLGSLQRTGFRRAGVDNPETVLEHSFGTAVLASIIATMEGIDADRCVAIAMFHDIGEIGTGDIDPKAMEILEKIGASKESLDKAAEELQMKELPLRFRQFLQKRMDEFRSSKKIGRCVQDADLIHRGLTSILSRRVARFPGHLEKMIVEIAEQLKTKGGAQFWQIILESRKLLEE